MTSDEDYFKGCRYDAVASPLCPVFRVCDMVKAAGESFGNLALQVGFPWAFPGNVNMLQGQHTRVLEGETPHPLYYQSTMITMPLKEIRGTGGGGGGRIFSCLSLASCGTSSVKGSQLRNIS